VVDNGEVAEEAIAVVWGVRMHNRPPAFFVTESAALAYSDTYDGEVFVARERLERPQLTDD
jgi:hypothetical protein